MEKYFAHYTLRKSNDTKATLERIYFVSRGITVHSHLHCHWLLEFAAMLYLVHQVSSIYELHDKVETILHEKEQYWNNVVYFSLAAFFSDIHLLSKGQDKNRLSRHAHYFSIELMLSIVCGQFYSSFQI